MSSKTEGNNFDLIRFFFASLVILSHAYPMATGTEAQEPLWRFSRGQLTLGTLSVDCFFIISGYLIAQSWSRKPDIISYLSKRVRRIYPGFLVAAMLSAFVVTPLFTAHPGKPSITPAFTLDFMLHALRLLYLQSDAAFPNNPAPGSVNGSLWSIPFEFWCYIGLMGTGLLGLLKRPGLLLAWLAVLTVVAFVVAYHDLKIGGKFLGVIFGYPTFWSRLLPYFVAGMVFHSYSNRIPLTGRGAAVATALMLAGCAVPYALIFVLPVCGAYLILWLAFIPSAHVRHFARRGDYSYGIYLYAFPIGQIIASYTGKTSPWLLFLLAWPLSVLAGALSWHLVEKHFMKTKARRRPAELAGAP